MPFRKAFEGVVSKIESKTGAPPIPFLSKPSSSHHGPPPVPARQGQQAPPPYWQPRFLPDVPVAQNFRHELGAHGWGNNELQDYRADHENSFHTPDGKLVVRCVASGGRVTSARLTSHQLLARRRGCLSAVLQAPSAVGVWPAFWLLPADPFAWPGDGEVDVLESWNAEQTNHSCLHWGHHDAANWDKHRVRQTPMDPAAVHAFALAWDQPERGDGGRLVWYIDGRAVMKAERPAGTRRMEDWRVLLNVAAGGNVCQGRVPVDGRYDLVIHEIRMCDAPDGGWEAFENDWRCAEQGGQ